MILCGHSAHIKTLMLDKSSVGKLIIEAVSHGRLKRIILSNAFIINVTPCGH